MLEEFKNFVNRKDLLDANETCLLAISGGLDSCAMAHLFHLAKIPFAIAHVNYQLRGKDSDEDESFCKSLADKYKVPFHTIRFKTNELANQQKTSIQLIARALRYEWFEKLISDNDYSKIATAHHLNDSIETFIYNFSKGTGLKGLLGIPLNNGPIIRPMLFANREAIEGFAKAEKLEWREDSSNAEDKYQRNKIRHHITPILKDINPALESTTRNTFENLQETQALIDWAILNWKEKLFIKDDDLTKVQFEPLLKLPFASTLLYEWFKEYGFHADQMDQILNNLSQFPNHNIGATFLSDEYSILIDRNFLIFSVNKIKAKSVYQLAKDTKEISLTNGTFAMDYLLHAPNSFPQTTFLAYLNLSEEDFPLQLRHWENGDVFQPLGMKGKHQKLQDFFIHQKVTRFEKDRIWILETARKEIAWVVGYRIDERFKITEKQNACYTFTFKPL